MFKQNTLVATPTEVIPTRGKSLRKTQEGLERQAPGRTARLAQANQQLRHQIKRRRHAEGLLLKEQHVSPQLAAVARSGSTNGFL